ncbi:hypothetical protein [Candidatus Korobacter versatilis]|uniref:hypothetical protein n=1 Tax=Candidatus Korobacter versatilis TaxID=658062 RepID=UPI0011D11C53|nr:hypothetical protein [Candidatus Koribacter versatilis]
MTKTMAIKALIGSWGAPGVEGIAARGAANMTDPINTAMPNTPSDPKNDRIAMTVTPADLRTGTPRQQDEC